MGRGRMTCWGGLDEGVQLPKARQAHPGPDARTVRPFAPLSSFLEHPWIAHVCSGKGGTNFPRLVSMSTACDSSAILTWPTGPTGKLGWKTECFGPFGRLLVVGE